MRKKIIMIVVLMVVLIVSNIGFGGEGSNKDDIPKVMRTVQVDKNIYE